MPRGPDPPPIAGHLSGSLVLSIFPGIDLLGRAFEEEGFCVARGPDVLWGGDIRGFHPPGGVFEGVIGGPPCKGESNLAALNGRQGQTLVDEFWRVAQEAEPQWWVMEAVVRHEAPHVLVLSPRWLGEKQSRRRYFHSNLDLAAFVDVAIFEDPEFKYAVLAAHGGGVGSVYRRMAKYSLEEACELQGLPADFAASLPFTRDQKYEVIGNAVPMSMGRAVARAVKKAIHSNGN